VSTPPWHLRRDPRSRLKLIRHCSVGMTSSPVRKVSIATELAHRTNSSSEVFFISVRKYTRPMASAWTRVALIKISSIGPLLRVGGKSAPKTGTDTWLLAKSWWKKYEKKSRVRGLRVVKSTGLNIDTATQSFATHHAYAFATLRILVKEISLASKPSPSSFKFLRTSAPPTEASPRSRKKSHRQNCSVILYEWEVRQRCWPRNV